MAERRTRRKKDIEKEMEETIQEKLESPLSTKTNKKRLKSQNILSLGSTLLNLACTDNAKGGLLKGRYYLLVGAEQSGKTWACMTIFAESSLHKRFKNYRLFYDNGEDGANMDMDFYFGKTTVERIEAPEPNRVDKNGIPMPYSKTLENFYDSLNNKLDQAEEEGKGIIYILDSLDSLTTEAELKKIEEQRKARKEEKKVIGSMTDGKAKINSANLRTIANRLDKSGSFLIIVCQERDDMSTGYKTFSGGNAPVFYSTLIPWFKKYKDIKASIEGKERILGTLSKVNIKRNRLTGQKHNGIFLPIYHSFGIDNIGSIIDWLLDEGYWEGGKTSTSKIKAVDFDIEKNKESLARYIEENNLEDRLDKIAQNLWDTIKVQIANKVIRKEKYK